MSRETGEPYKDRLLPLPEFLWRKEAPEAAGEIVAGLTLTGHFLRTHVLEPQGLRLPEARERFFERMRRLAEPHLFML